MPTVPRWQVVNLGETRRDAGAMFGSVPRKKWEEICNLSYNKDHTRGKEGLPWVTAKSNEIHLGCNGLFVQVGEQNILIDTGPPASGGMWTEEGLRGKMLTHALKAASVKPAELTDIIFTSADLDHVGGAVRRNGDDNKARWTPMCPGANHHISAASSGASYSKRPNHVPSGQPALDILENHECLHHHSEAEVKIAPGVRIIREAGYSGQHSLVLIEAGPETILFLGDLVPAYWMLGEDIISAYDNDPHCSYQSKKYWIEEATKKGWCVVFAHGDSIKAGFLEPGRGEATRTLRVVC